MSITTVELGGKLLCPKCRGEATCAAPEQDDIKAGWMPVRNEFGAAWLYEDRPMECKPCNVIWTDRRPLGYVPAGALLGSGNQPKPSPDKETQP